MFFSRIMLREDAVRSPELMRVLSSPYALHQSIWQLFSDDRERKRDFLYRLDQSGLRPIVYAVSAREPVRQSGKWHVEPKEYSPRLRPGTALSFVLRANPVVTRRDVQDRAQRHDVVMDSRKSLQAAGERNIQPSSLLAQEAGVEWLCRRAERHGFAIRKEEVLTDGYRRERLARTRGGADIQFSQLDFAGRLTVVDPDLFVQALFHGVGKSKAFGCGLLLVRRA